MDAITFHTSFFFLILFMTAAVLLRPQTASAANIINKLDETNGLGSTTSLTLDVSGNPVIAYYDGVNGDLKLVHCNDPVCAGSNFVIRQSHTESS
jgi:hypothetical protein